MIFIKRKRKLCWKKFHQAFQDEHQKKRILILLTILNKIPEDNENAVKVEESVTTICKEEGISFEQVFYILFFDAVFISNKPSFRFYSSLAVWRDAYKCTLQEKMCKFLLRFPQMFFLYTLFESNLVSQMRQWKALEFKNELNFKDSKWNHQLIRYKISAIFQKVKFVWQRLVNLQKGSNKTFF